MINHLYLPRYGLAQYVAKDADRQATPVERALLANLSHAGKRLMGFCRTNLYKRHILRN